MKWNHCPLSRGMGVQIALEYSDYTRKILKNIYSTLISLGIGVACTPAFYFLNGIIANFDIKKHLNKWTYSLPKTYILTAQYVHLFAVEIFVALPITFLAGLSISHFIQKKQLTTKLAGFVGFLGYLLAETFYYFFLRREFEFHHYSLRNIEYTIPSIILWSLLFVTMMKLGIFIHKKIR